MVRMPPPVALGLGSGDAVGQSGYCHVYIYIYLHVGVVMTFLCSWYGSYRQVGVLVCTIVGLCYHSTPEPQLKCFILRVRLTRRLLELYIANTSSKNRLHDPGAVLKHMHIYTRVLLCS